MDGVEALRDRPPPGPGVVGDFQVAVAGEAFVFEGADGVDEGVALVLAQIGGVEPGAQGDVLAARQAPGDLAAGVGEAVLGQVDDEVDRLGDGDLLVAHHVAEAGHGAVEAVPGDRPERQGGAGGTAHPTVSEQGVPAAGAPAVVPVAPAVDLVVLAVEGEAAHRPARRLEMAGGEVLRQRPLLGEEVGAGVEVLDLENEFDAGTAAVDSRSPVPEERVAVPRGQTGALAVGDHVEGAVGQHLAKPLVAGMDTEPDRSPAPSLPVGLVAEAEDPPDGAVGVPPADEDALLPVRVVLDDGVRDTRPSPGDGGWPWANRVLSSGGEQKGGGDRAAADAGQGDLGAGNLAVAALAPQLFDRLGHLREAVDPAGAEVAAVGADGQVAAEPAPAFGEPGSGLALLHEAEVLQPAQRHAGEAVVELGHVDVGGGQVGAGPQSPRPPSARP